MKILNSRHLKELKHLENYLKSLNSKERIFQRVYENKKEKDDKKYIKISDCGYSLTAEEIIEYLTSKGYLEISDFNSNDINAKIIKVNDYFNLLETVHYLIDILEYDIYYKETIKNKTLINSPASI
jgi:hypothetical protein